MLDVDGPIGAARQRLADDRLHAGRSGRADHHFARVLLPQPQRLFERVGIGLVHLVAGVLLANPGLRVIQTWLPFAGRDLLDTNRYLHVATTLTDTSHGGTKARRYLLKNRLRVSVSPWPVTVDYPSNLLNSSAALVPPNPNEFDSAY